MATQQLHSVLITGANRGLGLQFVKDFLALKPAAPSHIIATARDPSKAEELNKLAAANASVKVLQLEVTDYPAFDKFASAVADIVGEKGLSLLVNNAGVAIRPAGSFVTAKEMLDTYSVNSISPLLLSNALLPLLRKSSSAGQRTVIANITSKMGSIDDNTSGGFHSYRASKSALNQITKSMSIDMKQDKIEVVAVHPGWVLTDMGGPNALITPEVSVSNMVRVITELDRPLNGLFLNYDGAPIKW